MRMAQTAGPDSLRDTASYAQTSETAPETITNPIDFGEIADVNLTKSSG